MTDFTLWKKTWFIGSSLVIVATLFLAQDGIAETAPDPSLRYKCQQSDADQRECVPKVPDVAVKDLVCAATEMGTAKFKLCNLEVAPVTAKELDPTAQNFAYQISPRLPITIEPDARIDMVI